MKRRFFWSIAACAMALWALTALSLIYSAPASAQDADRQSLVDRLERLERDIRTINTHLSRGGDGAVNLKSGDGTGDVNAPAVARIGLRMDRLEQDLRSTTGVIEEVNHRILQVSDRLDKLVSDVDFRLSTLESAGTQSGQMQPNAPSLQRRATPNGTVTQATNSVAGANAPDMLGTVSSTEIQKIQSQLPRVGTATPSVVGTPEPTRVLPSAPAPTGALPAGTPKEQYAYAFNLLQQTNYEQAATALKSFVEVNGDDPLASNARYWLGETYYVRGLYQDAAQTFYDGYQKDPKGPKAADTLLKLGMSLAGLGKKDDACAAFAKIQSDFSKVSGSVKNAIARENKRNGCS